MEGLKVGTVLFMLTLYTSPMTLLFLGTNFGRIENLFKRVMVFSERDLPMNLAKSIIVAISHSEMEVRRVVDNGFLWWQVR